MPSVDFGIATGDPADAMFVSANFPGSPSSTQLTAARELYSILTGRINSITANARLNEASKQYEFLGQGTERGRMRELGFFAQDSWRMRPNLTVNAGLRYELQLPFYALNDSYYQATLADVWGVSGVGNLFEPGVLEGKKPQFVPFNKGTRAYNLDTNNFAPSLGFAWTPGARSGFLGRLVGASGDTVLRGGYAYAYNRPGMSSFRGIYSANPGITLDDGPQRDAGESGSRRRIASTAVPRSGPPWAAAISSNPGDPVYRGDHRGRQRVRSRTFRSRTLRRGRPAFNGRSVATWRSRCATWARATCSPGRR